MKISGTVRTRVQRVEIVDRVRPMISGNARVIAARQVAVP